MGRPLLWRRRGKAVGPEVGGPCTGRTGSRTGLRLHAEEEV